MSTKHILIADDDKDLVDSLKLRCRHLGLTVTVVHDALSALSAVRQSPPDLICLDVNMPAGNGLSVCEMLATDPSWSSIPVIIITGKADQQIEQRCHALGAYFVPKCPDLWSRVEPLIFELLEPTQPAPIDQVDNELAQQDTRAPQSLTGANIVTQINAGLEHVEQDGDSPPGVLVIDDEPAFAEALRMRLRPFGVPVTCVGNGMAGYRTAFTHPLAAIILDFQMPNGRGDYVLRRLKENPATQDIPVIVLTGRKDKALERTMLNLGATRYFTKPVVFDELVEELRLYIRPGVSAVCNASQS